VHQFSFVASGLRSSINGDLR